MSNQLTKTAMATLFDEVAESTSINQTLSKSLRKWNMDDLSNMGRTGEATTPATNQDLGSATDIEYIPQEYRFIAKDGIVSDPNARQGLIDRNIPVKRNRAKHITATLNTRDLRDPQRRQNKMLSMSREIANIVDVTCYQHMLNQASMVHVSSNTFTYQDGIDAELLMQNRGLSAFDRNLYLSNKDYAQIAKELGTAGGSSGHANQQYGSNSVTDDALMKAMVPNLSTFDTMRSDYLLNLAPPTDTGAITVAGADSGGTKFSHDVTTFNADGFYQDNRSQILAMAGVSATRMPIGTKFTIDGITALHEETRTDNGELQTFTVITTSATAPRIQPAIVPLVSGTDTPYANCAIDSRSAVRPVTILNPKKSTPSLFYTPESTVLIPGRLPVPHDAGGVEIMEATTEQGLPMRFSYWYEPDNEIFVCKILVFFDVQVIYPNQLGCIISGQGS